MGEWPEVQLQELAASETGSIAIGPFGSRMKSDTYVPDGVPVIRGTNISGERGWKGDWVFVSDDLADSMPNCNARENDLVFAHRGAIGEVAIVPADRPRYMLSTSFMKFRPDTRKANPLYLFYFFRSSIGRHEILKYASQVGTPGIGQPLRSLRQFKVPLPPLEVQTEIAGILAALDDKIELNRRMNETLEGMARAIFQDWFVEFGPTRAKMEGREPYLVPDIWVLFPDRLNDKGKPEKWEDAPLSAFFSIISGGTPKTSVPEYWGGSIPWFSVVDTPPSGSVFVVETEKTITEAGLNASPARLIPAGATIISARGTVGNLAMAAQEMAFNQSCYALRAESPVGDTFVYLVAQNMVDRLKAMAHGSVFSTITRQTFQSLSLPMPSVDVMPRFEQIAGALFAKIKCNVLEASTIVQIRDLLLPKLMTGEIRVAEVDKQMERHA